MTGSEESITSWANLPPSPSAFHIDTVVVTSCVMTVDRVPILNVILGRVCEGVSR